MRLVPVVCVMLMKVMAPLLDMGSTPVTSTRAACTEEGILERDTADCLCSCRADGGVLDSTGLVVVTGDIRKAISVTKQTIIAAPKAMAAAA